MLKFDANGNLTQNLQLGGSCWKGITSIHIDKNQNLYISGGYGNDNFWTTSSCTCIFDGTSHTTTSTDIFLAKYDSLGNLLWINTIEANQNINTIRLNIDRNSIFLSGRVSNSNIPIDFGTYTLNYPSNYYTGSFVARYNTSGTFQWAKYYGAKGWDSYVYPHNIAILNSNVSAIVNRQ